ncbi:hypothetical protein [Streptomyces sp. NBC_00151]|uniref:hypothetical protein n=1 Tax=Streptomyces sp. NBC_00151 TaxID=2975669 RepID=UPI002DDB2062|nr:hypothetical protein [Streptomyces sp. NBC_00151]WRZ41075.1 hypothetical protein OG915_25375 [Streptomyces sp. NBC_00151]
MASKLPTEPISGGQYPVLKGKAGNVVFENPPFHPNILNVGGANRATQPARTDDYNVGTSKSFHRGVMVAGAGINASWPGNITFRINFLYNPSTIQESRSVDVTSGVLPNWARNPDDPGQYNTPLQSVINFSLLFDRTYELWDQSYRETLAGVFGARVDVEAFYNLMGVNALVSETTPQHGTIPAPLQTSGRVGTVVQGPMQMVPARIYFGQNSTGALNYYGYISTFDVTYTHFNSMMTPSRCAINVGFTILPNNYTAGTAGNSG